MDPNTALASAREALSNFRQAESTDEELEPSDDLAGAFEALDEWLTKGGFLPDAWKPTGQYTSDAGNGDAVFRMLDLSTMHLPEEAREDLNSYDGIIATDREYGWFVHVPQDPDEHFASYSDGPPAEVIDILRYAHERGCAYALFDQDADENPNLPTFED